MDAGKPGFDVRLLSQIKREHLEAHSKAELSALVQSLARELVQYRDELYGPNRAASMFNRRRTWIYDAMSRPRTWLQRQVAKVVIREAGGLLFPLADLVQIRRRLRNREKEKRGGMDAKHETHRTEDPEPPSSH